MFQNHPSGRAGDFAGLARWFRVVPIVAVVAATLSCENPIAYPDPAPNTPTTPNTPPAATKLVFLTQPGAMAAGANLNPAIKVAVQDANGNTVSNATTSVSLAISSGTGSSGATLIGTSTQSAVNGVATFGAITIQKAGSGFSLTASAANLESGVTNAFDVTPGAATKIVVAAQPTGGMAGSAISPALQFGLQDAFGNVVTNSAATVNVAITSGTGAFGATLGGTLTQPVVGGTATFGDLTIAKAAAGYALTASGTSLASATTSTFSVAPGPAAKLRVLAQSISATATATINPPVLVAIEDAFGNSTPAAIAPVTLAITNGTGTAGAVLSGTLTRAAANGVATFDDLKIDKAGNGYTFTASAPGLVEATTPSFIVGAATPSKLMISVQPSAVAVGASITPAIEVSVLDASGNLVSNATTSVTLAITGGTGTAGAVLSGTTTRPAVAGIASFSNMSISKTGTGYTLTASAANLSSATTNAFSVSAGAPAKLGFLVQPASGTSATSLAPAVQVAVQDAQGNTITSSNATVAIAIASGTGAAGAVLGGTLSKAAVNGIATFSDLKIDKAGAGYALRTSATSLTSATSSTFAISAGAASKLRFSTQPSSAAIAAAISPFQVEVQDAQGNTVSTATTSVTIGITPGTGAAGAMLGGTTVRAASSGFASFNNISIDKAGDYTLTATATNLTSATSSVFAITGGTASSCANPAPGWIWCDDFDTDRLGSYFSFTTANGNFARASGVGRNGSAGMRARWGAGQVDAGALRMAFGRTPATDLRPVDAGTRDYREIWWRVYVRYAPGWVGGGADKLSRATVFATSNWAQARIAHVWSGTGSEINILAIDPASGTDAAGNLKTTGWNDMPNLRWLGGIGGTTPIFDANHVGQWLCIENHVKLNTAGQSDGVFELFINGQFETSRTGLNWVGAYNAYGINGVFLENYWNAGSPATQERYLDDFVVSETRVGC